MPDLILMGAGASYGSENDTTLVPPLAVDLFDALLKFEPKLWSHVTEEVAAEFRLNFEQGVLAQYTQSRVLLSHLQRSMAGFFFRYGPSSANLYLKLANRIKKTGWAGSVATLNYERLLQFAMIRAGLNIVCGPNLTPNSTEICFPHGCCNLFCESVRGAAGMVAMDPFSVSTRGPIIALDEPRSFWHRLRTDAFPPVMSYFEPAKMTTSGANFIEQQRGRLQDLIVGADYIAIIGVTVREQDNHIWDSLAATKARIYYCSGVASQPQYFDWQKRKRPNSGDIVSDKYWKEDFEAVCDHMQLQL